MYPRPGNILVECAPHPPPSQTPSPPLQLFPLNSTQTPKTAHSPFLDVFLRELPRRKLHCQPEQPGSPISFVRPTPLQRQRVQNRAKGPHQLRHLPLDTDYLTHQPVRALDLIRTNNPLLQKIRNTLPPTRATRRRQRGQPHPRPRHLPLAVLEEAVTIRTAATTLCTLPIRQCRRHPPLHPLVAHPGPHDGPAPARAPHPHPQDRLDDFQPDHDPPSHRLPRPLGHHLAQQLRVLDRPQQRRAPRVQRARQLAEARVPGVRGGRGGRRQQVRVVGGQEGQEGLQGFRGQRAVVEAARDQVLEGAQGRLQLGDLGGVGSDKGFVRAEPLFGEG